MVDAAIGRFLNERKKQVWVKLDELKDRVVLFEAQFGFFFE